MSSPDSDYDYDFCATSDDPTVTDTDFSNLSEADLVDLISDASDIDPVEDREQSRPQVPLAPVPKSGCGIDYPKEQNLGVYSDGSGEDGDISSTCLTSDEDDCKGEDIGLAKTTSFTGSFRPISQDLNSTPSILHKRKRMEIETAEQGSEDHSVVAGPSTSKRKRVQEISRDKNHLTCIAQQKSLRSVRGSSHKAAPRK